MPTQEERLNTLEQTLAFLQKKSGVEIQDLNRNMTMLLGIASGQELDIKEVKINLATMKDRLDTIEHRLDEHTRTLAEHTLKFDRIEQLLTQILARLPEQPSSQG